MTPKEGRCCPALWSNDCWIGPLEKEKHEKRKRNMNGLTGTHSSAFVRKNSYSHHRDAKGWKTFMSTLLNWLRCKKSHCKRSSPAKVSSEISASLLPTSILNHSSFNSVFSIRHGTWWIPYSVRNLKIERKNFYRITFSLGCAGDGRRRHLSLPIGYRPNV